LEVLFVEDQVNSENITSMADIQNNFQTNLEDKLFKLAETMDLSRAEVDDMLAKLTTTTTITISTTTTTVSFINPSAFLLVISRNLPKFINKIAFVLTILLKRT